MKRRTFWRRAVALGMAVVMLPFASLSDLGSIHVYAKEAETESALISEEADIASREQETAYEGGTVSENDGNVPIVQPLQAGTPAPLSQEEHGFILEGDRVYEGNLLLADGVIDLNGHSLTVEGDLIQPAGTIQINGGSLTVKGDYRMQAADEDVSGSGEGAGQLVMANEDDHVCVEGSLFWDTSVSGEALLTAGVLEIKGDAIFAEGASGTGFSSGGTHILRLSGEEAQRVSFSGGDSYRNGIANLELTNTGEAGIVLEGVPYISGAVTDHAGKVEGDIAIGRNTLFPEGYFGGGICIGQDTVLDDVLKIGGDLTLTAQVNVSGTVMVGGGLIQKNNGRLYFDRCSLTVEGDYLTESGYTWLLMSHEEDYLHVKGNVDFHPDYQRDYYLSAGTIEIGGDLTSAKGLWATGTHRFLFSGEGLQTISVTDDEYFAIVELANHSEEGVSAERIFRRDKLITNGCRITYGSLQGEYGWKLEKDTVYEGNLVLLEDTLDLNGYSLTVTGDLVQLAGEVKVNGGRLRVQGDYRMQVDVGDIPPENAATESGKSAGQLIMINEADYVLVEGSFVSESTSTVSGLLTDGILEICGDFTVSDSASGKSFIATENHKVLLSGEGLQTVCFGDGGETPVSGADRSRLANLELTNTGSEGILILQAPYVSGAVTDHAGKVGGDIAIGTSTVFPEGYFGGGAYIGHDTVLDDTVTFGGSLTLAAQTNVSGAITAGGSLTQKNNGRLYFDRGSLTVEGDYLTEPGYTWLWMSHEEDYLHVKGNVDFHPDYQRDYYLSAGTIEIGGDLTSAKGLWATGTHRFLFSGESLQTISVTDDEYFAIVELKNNSEEGVSAEKPFRRDRLITNGCRITYGSLQGEYGRKLEKDTVYEGDLVLLEDTLDLNGYSLTVTGDLVQLAGEVKVNGGRLTVEGDYRIQSRTGEDGYSYGTSTGQLVMTHENDYVLVKGSFVSESTSTVSGLLTDGILEICGDFTVSDSASGKSFIATENHKVLLSGEGLQTVCFGDGGETPTSGADRSRLANLELTNTGSEGILILQAPYVSGAVTDHAGKVEGDIAIGTSTVFPEGYFGGGAYIGQNTVLDDTVTFGGSLTLAAQTDISGAITAGGSLTQREKGVLQFDRGSLTVEGDYLAEPKYNWLRMSHEEDYLHVKGNADFNPGRQWNNYLSAGTIEIGGDLTSTKGLYATGTHRFLFSGEGLQTISVTDDEYFAIVELKNNSEEGVSAEKPFRRDRLITNGCRITYGSLQGEYGRKLEKDTVYEGDLVLLEDTLDLNGYSLTVTGDLVQLAGEVKVNGGRLTVEGDYRIQSRTGEDGYSYGTSTGQLVMTHENDYVLVKGSFVSESTSTVSGLLTDGILEICGDFTVSDSASGKSFIATENHKILLSGEGLQTVCFGDGGETPTSGADRSRLANLELTNTGSEGILILQAPYVSGAVTDHAGKVEGDIAIGTSTVFPEGYFGGGAYIGQNTVLDDTVTFGGSLTLAAQTDISGAITAGGSLTQREKGVLQFDRGSLTVEGDYLAEPKYNWLRMSHEEDYLHVKGNADFNPGRQWNNYLSAGTIEIGGDLTSTKGLYATGTHRFLFSGEGLQTISVTDDEYFAIVELANHSREGIFAESFFARSRLIDNGCRITYLGQAGEYGWKLEEDSVRQGDLVLLEGTLDLNGHSLTVTGDLIQPSGEVRINGGSLTVEGDYRIQSRTAAADSDEASGAADYLYGISAGRLTMTGAEDRVTVLGDFVVQTSAADSSLSAGILELKGNFRQQGSRPFVTGGTHTLVFSGAQTQTVTQEKEGTLAALTNRTGGRLLIRSPLTVTGMVTDESGRTGGEGYLRLRSLEQLADGCFGGSVVLTESDILDKELQVGSLTIWRQKRLELAGHRVETEELTVNGDLVFQGGSVSCGGDVSVLSDGRLIMQQEMDYLLCGGDFLITSGADHRGMLTAGTLEICGNFRQDSAVNFVATDNHTTVFSRPRGAFGTRQVQSIAFKRQGGTTRFATLLLKRSQENYVFVPDKERIADRIVYEVADENPPAPVAYINQTEVTETTVTIAYGGAEDDTGVTGYEIRRDGIRIGVTAENCYTDRGLLPGKAYTYTVYPFDGDRNMAEESPKATVLTEMDTQPPQAPTEVLLSGRTGSSLSLRWKAAADNTGIGEYHVYRNGEKIAEGLTGTSYRDTGLSANTLYRYTVVAYDLGGNASPESPVLEAAVALPRILDTVPGDRESVGGSQVTLKAYFADNGGTGRTENTGDSETSGGNRLGIEYLDGEGQWQRLTPALLPQKRYNSNTLCAEYAWDIRKITDSRDVTLRYTLYDADGNTDVVERVCHVDREAPGLPENLRAVSEDGTVTLTWEPSVSADCAYYRIYRREAESASWQLLTELTELYAAQYADSAVEEGESYEYRMTVGDALGNFSEPSQSVEIIVSQDREAPVVTEVTPGAGRIGGRAQIGVSAKDNRSVTKLILQYRREGQGQWTFLEEKKALKGETFFIWDTSALEDGVYYLGALAEDEAGNRTQTPCIRRYEVDNTGIAQIQLTSGKADATTATLEWEDVTEEDFAFFRIEQSEGEDFRTVGEVSERLGYVVTGLTPGTAYRFRVVGYDTAGNRGIPSEEMELLTLADTEKPVITAVYPVASVQPDIFGTQTGSIQPDASGTSLDTMQPRPAAAYRDTLELEVRARDNEGIDRAVFSSSLDGKKYEDIAIITNTEEGQEAALRYTYDISALPEGSVFIRFRVYDRAGNVNAPLSDGEEVILEYRIDCTAPGKVEELTATGVEGYADLTWKENKEKDLAYYRIYRAEEETDVFRLVCDGFEGTHYCDTATRAGKSYLYRVSAVDRAGNESEMSAVSYVTIGEDKKAPLVTGMSPEEGSRVGCNPQFRIVAMDNASLAELTLEYQQQETDTQGEAAGAAGIWHTIARQPLSDRSCLTAVSWRTEGLSEGEYLVKATVKDSAGNESESLVVSYTLDLTPPPAPQLAVSTGHFAVELSLSGEQGEDFDYYELYRRLPGEREQTLLTSGSSRTYTDRDVEPGTVYLYQAVACDRSGNAAHSPELEGYADDVDVEAPMAVLPENLTGIAGMELALDGTASYDNVRITEYLWDMGNGDTLTGASPVYCYEEPGTYPVTLTVSDAAGNTGHADMTVRILDKTGNGAAELTITDEQGEPIPYAQIYVKNGETSGLVLKADSLGRVTYAGSAGVHTLAVYKSGYLPQEMEITLSDYRTGEYRIPLQKHELVVGDLRARRMTLEEMQEAGIDFSDPKNYHIFTFKVTLTFKQSPYPLEINYIGTPGSYLNLNGGGGGGVLVGGGSAPGMNLLLQAVQTEGEEETPVLAYLSTTQSVSWLKDFYEVRLGVLNAAAEDFVIENARAVLNLPEKGVSLAQTAARQSLEQEMGSIPGQQQQNASWTVRGDESGSYALSASFEGTLMPFGSKVSALFTMEQEFTVTTGEGIHIYIMPEAAAYIGERYYIQFAVCNESPRPIYNFKTTIGPYQGEKPRYVLMDIQGTGTYKQVCEEVEITDNSSTTQSVVVTDGQSLVFTSLEPGDIYYGTYKRLFGAEGDPDEVYYQLVDTLVETLKGDNLNVEVSVEPLPSHLYKCFVGNVYLPSFYADPVDLSTGYFSEEMTAFTLSGAANVELGMRYQSGVTGNAGELGYGWYHDYEMRLERQGGVLRFYQNPSSAMTFVSKDALEGRVYGHTMPAGQTMPAGDTRSVSGGDPETEEEQTAKLLPDTEIPLPAEYTCLNGGCSDYALTAEEDGTYTLRVPAGNTYRFDEEGRLIRVTGREGKSIRLEHKETATTVTEEISGRSFTLHYDSEGHLTLIGDSAGRTVRFAYDEGDRLTALTGPSGETVTYTYDEQNRILTESNSAGTFVTNSYDALGRVVSQKDALGRETTFAYTGDTASGSAMTVTITDPAGVTKQAFVDQDGNITGYRNENGSTVTYTYDASGRLLTETDTYGATLRREYDEEGNLIAVTDKNGRKSFYAYDGAGSLTAITDGSGRSASYEYNENNLPVRSTDPAGLVTTYAYDGNGQLTEAATEGLGAIRYTYENGILSSVTDYNGGTARYRYDGAGNVAGMTDALGNETAYTHDHSGRLLSVTDALGGTTSYTYDHNGNLSSVTDALGRTTRNVYDNAGRQTALIYPDGTRESYEYDACGNLTRITLPDGAVHTYEYDTAGNPVKETLPDGTVLTCRYDLLGQRLSETDGEGNTTAYSYYPNGQLKKITYADGTWEAYTYTPAGKTESVTTPLGTTRYAYDACGRTTAVTDALGNTRNYAYDKAGRLLSETDPNGNTTSYTYDANSNCLTRTDALGHTLHMEYDAGNRMTAAYLINSRGEKYEVSYTYDALGRVSTVTDECGSTIRYTYDACGNLISTTDAEGNESATAVYDALGRTVQTLNAGGAGVSYTYDAAGNLTQKRAVSGTAGTGATETGTTETGGVSTGVPQNPTTYTYDACGRPVSVTDPLAGTTGISYDKNGNITSVTDANGGTTAYAYDEMDRLLLEVSPLGSRTAYSYNAQGLPCRTQNARGQESTCTYDALGRVTSVTDALGTVTYTYDKNGNLLTVTDKNGTITRQYDALNRVTQYTDCRGNRVSYAYDELGNLLSLTYPGGETVRYTYYPNGLLHTVEDPEGGTTSYTYDKNGRLTRTLRPNGTEETRTYDREGRLTGLKDIRTADGEILAGYTYAYDGRGNLTRITGLTAAESTASFGSANLGSANLGGAITGAEGRLSGAVHTPAAEPAAVPAGTANFGTANLGSVLTSAEMTYGPDNRMLTYNGEALRYDADGNMTYGPVDGVMTQLSYDCRNRLVQAGGTTYAYDAEDNRIRMETADTTEEYVTDTVSASLSRVLVVTVIPKEGAAADTEGAGEQTLCVYGQGLISEHREGTALYHHYNHLGSTVKLTDESGETAAAYAYGPYGELLGGSPALSRYLYNGRLGVTTDGNGLYYMRQRYYNPETKRFVNQDILRGNPADSRSLNRYSYVQGNPVSYTDPFGLSPLGAMFEGTGFVHGLFGLLGMLPGPIGIAANLADFIVYAVVDKNVPMAICTLADVFFMGSTYYVKVTNNSNWFTRLVDDFNAAFEMASNTATFAQCSSNMMAASFAMYDKYVIRGEAVTADTFWEVAGLGLSAAGCIWSGASLRGSITQTAVLVESSRGYQRISSSLAETMQRVRDSRGYQLLKSYHLNNKGMVDLSFLFKSGTSSISNQKPDLYHYTDANGARAIQESGMIKTDSRGRVFVTTDEIRPQDANNALFMGVKGDDCATHRVEINLIDPNDVNLTTNGVTQPNELIYLGTLRNGKNANFIVKENDF